MESKNHVFDILNDEIEKFFSNHLKFTNESQLMVNKLCSSISKILNFYYINKKFLVVSNFIKKGDEEEFKVYFNSLDYSVNKPSMYKIKILPSINTEIEDNDTNNIRIYKFKDLDYYIYIAILKYD